MFLLLPTSICVFGVCKRKKVFPEGKNKTDKPGSKSSLRRGSKAGSRRGSSVTEDKRDSVTGDKRGSIDIEAGDKKPSAEAVGDGRKRASSGEIGAAGESPEKGAGDRKGSMASESNADSVVSGVAIQTPDVKSHQDITATSTDALQAAADGKPGKERESNASNVDADETLIHPPGKEAVRLTDADFSQDITQVSFPAPPLSNISQLPEKTSSTATSSISKKGKRKKPMEDISPEDSAGVLPGQKIRFVYKQKQEPGKESKPKRKSHGGKTGRDRSKSHPATAKKQIFKALQMPEDDKKAKTERRRRSRRKSSTKKPKEKSSISEKIPMKITKKEAAQTVKTTKTTKRRTSKRGTSRKQSATRKSSLSEKIAVMQARSKTERKSTEKQTTGPNNEDVHRPIEPQKDRQIHEAINALKYTTTKEAQGETVDTEIYRGEQISSEEKAPVATILQQKEAVAHRPLDPFGSVQQRRIGPTPIENNKAFSVYDNSRTVIIPIEIVRTRSAEGLRKAVAKTYTQKSLGTRQTREIYQPSEPGALFRSETEPLHQMVSNTRPGKKITYCIDEYREVLLMEESSAASRKAGGASELIPTSRAEKSREIRSFSRKPGTSVAETIEEQTGGPQSFQTAIETSVAATISRNSSSHEETEKTVVAAHKINGIPIELNVQISVKNPNPPPENQAHYSGNSPQFTTFKPYSEQPKTSFADIFTENRRVARGNDNGEYIVTSSHQEIVRTAIACPATRKFGNINRNFFQDTPPKSSDFWKRDSDAGDDTLLPKVHNISQDPYSSPRAENPVDPLAEPEYWSANRRKSSVFETARASQPITEDRSEFQPMIDDHDENDSLTSATDLLGYLPSEEADAFSDGVSANDEALVEGQFLPPSEYEIDFDDEEEIAQLHK